MENKKPEKCGYTGYGKHNLKQNKGYFDKPETDGLAEHHKIRAQL